MDICTYITNHLGHNPELGKEEKMRECRKSQALTYQLYS